MADEYVTTGALDPTVRAILGRATGRHEHNSSDDDRAEHRHETPAHTVHEHWPVIDTDHEEWTVVDCEHAGRINVRLVRPTGVTDPVPAIVYIRGGDLLSGAPATRDRLVQHLVQHTGAAVVCPDYGSAWDARHRQTVEQIHTVCRSVTTTGDEAPRGTLVQGIDPDTLVAVLAVPDRSQLADWHQMPGEEAGRVLPRELRHAGVAAHVGLQSLLVRAEGVEQVQRLLPVVRLVVPLQQHVQRDRDPTGFAEHGARHETAGEQTGGRDAGFDHCQPDTDSDQPARVPHGAADLRQREEYVENISPFRDGRLDERQDKPVDDVVDRRSD